MKTVPYAVSVLRRSTLTGKRVIWKMLAIKTLILTGNTERLYRAHQYRTVRGKGGRGVARPAPVLCPNHHPCHPQAKHFGRVCPHCVDEDSGDRTLSSPGHTAHQR